MKRKKKCKPLLRAWAAYCKWCPPRLAWTNIGAEEWKHIMDEACRGPHRIVELREVRRGVR